MRGRLLRRAGMRHRRSAPAAPVLALGGRCRRQAAAEALPGGARRSRRAPRVVGTSVGRGAARPSAGRCDGSRWRRVSARARERPRHAARRRLDVALGVERQIGRLVRQPDLGGEAAGAAARGSCRRRPSRWRWSSRDPARARPGRPAPRAARARRRAHAGDHLGQDLAPRVSVGPWAGHGGASRRRSSSAGSSPLRISSIRSDSRTSPSLMAV